MASALDRDRDFDSDSDSEFGYDLSLEDEKLLASLVDAPRAATEATAPATRPFAIPESTGGHRDASSSLPRSSPGGKTALVGIARTNSIAAFVHKTQPQSTLSLLPADDVKYPDRTFLSGKKGKRKNPLVEDNPD